MFIIIHMLNRKIDLKSNPNKNTSPIYMRFKSDHVCSSANDM